MTNKQEDVLPIEKKMTCLEAKQVACNCLDMAAAELMEFQDLIESQEKVKLSGTAFLAYEQALKSVYEWLQFYEENMEIAERLNDAIPGSPMAFYKGVE